MAPLVDLKQWLCQLQSSSLPTGSKPPILLEIIPQVSFVYKCTLK